MGQLIRIIFISLIMLTLPAFSAIEGKLNYSIPIDYSTLSEEELNSKADFYYHLAQETSKGILTEDITTALNLYSILANKNPENITYKVRLGTLYDLINKDKYAKGALYAAIGTNNTTPEPYFRLGEFYYKRQLYRKALIKYREAYRYGYSQNYETLYKIGDIYEKLGDSEAALKYFKLSAEINPNTELEHKIKKVEEKVSFDKEYYTNTRIHLYER